MDDPIRQYVREISRYTDAPLPFIEASAYWMVSTCLGHMFQMTQMRNTKMAPNLWVLLSSIPGRMRRSTIQGFAKDIVKEVMTQYYILTDHLSVEDAAMRVEQSFIEEGTPEGLIDHIQETKLKMYYVFSTEFGAVLKRAMSRDYEMGVLSLLSKLYYGESGSMLLSRRSKGSIGMRYIPPGLYVTMMAGCQEPGNYLTHDSIRQGLLRRILICFVEPTEVREWMEPLSMNSLEVTQVIEETQNRLKSLQQEYYPITKNCYNGKIQIHFVPSAMKEINSFAKACEDRIISDPSDVNIYRQTFWEHLAKLAALNAIANKRLAQVGDEIVLNVMPEDITQARSLFDFIDRKATAVVTNLEQVQAPVTLYTYHLQRLLNILRQNGGKMTQSDLLAKSCMLREDFDKVFQTLLTTRQIRIEVGEDKRIWVYLDEGWRCG